MAERHIPVEDGQEQRLLFGSLDRNVRAIRERWGVAVTSRRGLVRVAGDDEEAVREVTRRIAGALSRAREGDEPPTDAEVYSLLLEDAPASPADDAEDRRHVGDGSRRASPMVGRAHRRQGRPLPPLPEVRPATPNQAAYVQAIRRHDVVFAIGPAGTGKTFLAVAEAVASLRAGHHRKLVLTRPAVEAGEKLGFLPGDFQAKINPYLRPLYDALDELLRFGEVQRYLDSDVIEIVPLAYMRGRTLKGAFIILDEAQNTTPAQMKMFLTRAGADSKVVVTGDITQVDLPEGSVSGLVEARRVLHGVDGLAFVEFDGRDILRHPTVQRIVDAYERDAARKAEPGTSGTPTPP
jgi:phosphate starvation-inducible PhoH-like protein